MLDFVAFLALVACAAIIRSVVVGDYRKPGPVAPTEPLEPDPAVEALKADLKRQFAADAAAEAAALASPRPASPGRAVPSPT